MDYYYIIFFPAAVGIGGLMTFVIARRWYSLYDKLFMALLICYSLTVYTAIRNIAIGTGDFAYLILDNLQTLVGLILCPLLFLYIRTIAHDARWHGWYWWLFVPGIILNIAGTVLSILVGGDRILALRQNDYKPFIHDPVSIAEKLYLLVNVTLFNVLIEAMTIVLAGICIYYLVKYHQRIGNYYSNIEESCSSYMNRFLTLGILLLLMISCLSFFISDIEYIGHGIQIGLSLCMSAILSAMIYNAFNIRMSKKSREIMDMSDDDPRTGDDTIDQRVASWLGRKDKPFCKEGLTLVGLAKELGVSRQSLSAYVNSQMGMNFNQWINSLRVEEAKQLLQSTKDLKIGYISNICGFGSQSTFSKTFKHIVGCSPQSYRESAAR